MRLPVQGSEENQISNQMLSKQSCPFDYLVQESSEVALVTQSAGAIMEIMINEFVQCTDLDVSIFFC